MTFACQPLVRSSLRNPWTLMYIPPSPSSSPCSLLCVPLINVMLSHTGTGSPDRIVHNDAPAVIIRRPPPFACDTLCLTIRVATPCGSGGTKARVRLPGGFHLGHCQSDVRITQCGSGGTEARVRLPGGFHLGRYQMDRRNTQLADTPDPIRPQRYGYTLHHPEVHHLGQQSSVGAVLIHAGHI